VKRTLLVWALVACSPLTGIRMVCVEVPADPGAAAMTAEASAQCDRFCPRPNATRHDSPGEEAPAPVQHSPEETPDADGTHRTDCVLFADGSLFVLVSGAAILPSAAPIDFSPTLVPFEIEDRYSYPAPSLPLQTPPPKV
jgi:hypothetical protein